MADAAKLHARENKFKEIFQSQDNISLKMHQIPMLAFMDM